MNRDWFAQTQPETRGRIQVALDYFPQVNVDLHEQGGNNTYYFAPPADPLNPHYTKSQIAGFDLFGRANAARFDERGWPYYIREVYDGFYPGYGDSWPMFQGSIGMTYEQASARGLVVRAHRRHGDDLSRRRDAPLQRRHHHGDHRRRRTASGWSATSSTTGAARSPRARRAPVREYVLVPGHDPSRADRAGPQPGDAGHRGPARRRGGHGRRPHDSRRRLRRVATPSRRDG